MSTGTAPNTETKKSGNLLKSNALQQILAFASLIVLILFFTISSDNFLNWTNITGILLSTTVIGIMALGTTFVIMTGGIDLSIGTGMTLCAVMTGVFIVFWDLPIIVGILGGILTGALMGFISGFSVSKLKIPPFIATLAMMMIAKGLALVISDATPIYFSDKPSFSEIALGSIIPGFNLPNGVLIFIIMAIIAGILLTKSIFGRFTTSIGSNEEATRLSGINTDKWKIIIYTVAGVFTGIAGVLMASRLNSAQPALGAGYELEAIAAVVIGGTSLSGGKGTILGTVIGALIMSVLTNGLRIMSIPQEWQTVVVGFVILVAVYIDIIRRGKSS
ncbi:MAG: ABC transporter permease [Bacillaceae bacterium]|jgi:ribose transport system permease protein|uniref:Ribose ABC transporter permease n=2 Tax=Aeribacillus TaxID=1055323 RepID=A0A164BMD5_9BACI|nr:MULTISPECIES: ABC transporter permease [Aeribacillus]AXI39059.1 ABC transporter permease [Bacillaceae bacterium ZC4]REJ20953.1 MAG: ABC transporter permease [Bacillaceae bacterium]KZM57549.1 ribose ABC transporter permease [Aeribacillus pallidus]KZN95118.1 ribose ABC transporter permease [Aeribacillus pallidus]MDR9791801.1 ABC transporter permease [Aeribacillus pallidus]